LGALAELDQLDAPLLQTLERELGQRGVGDLALDLEDELLDARRRGQRLLVLQAGERDLVFLVREVKPDAARDQQRAADQGEDEKEVAAKEPAALDSRDLAMLFPDGLDRLQAALLLRFTLSPRLRERAALPGVAASARAPSSG
jgi:hypothetical protein